MEGNHGPMPISDFENIVYRNAYAPWNLRFYRERRGITEHGAPADTVVLLKGSMLDGEARNVPVPDVPEHTQMAKDKKHIAHRGWRMLLIMLCQDRWIQPSREIERLLGTEDYQKARHGLGCV